MKWVLLLVLLMLTTRSSAMNVGTTLTIIPELVDGDCYEHVCCDVVDNVIYVEWNYDSLA